jgi:N-acetylneuraminic acid mutarotase
MMHSEKKANQKVGMAAFALTMLIIFVLTAGAVFPLQAQTDSPAKAEPAVTHNTWTSGTALPHARMGAAAGAIGKDIYVVGGYDNSGVFTINEIYNVKTNTWTTGAPDPVARAFTASAVVNKILYVFGGSDFSELLSLTESYNPATNTWTTLAPMPYAQESASAVAVKDTIYVVGGQNQSSGYLNNVAAYNTVTNTWTEEAPMQVARGWLAVGKLGALVVTADGSAGAGDYFGDTEGYNAKKNTWAELIADPTPREAGCFAAIKGKLYVAGGNNGSLLTLNEAYNPKTKSWTALAPIPQEVWGAVASVETGGRLYCIGGGHYQQTVYDYVQIYQP